MWDYIVKYWLNWLMGLVALCLTAAWRATAKKLKDQQTESQAIKDGMIALLHNELYRECTKYLALGYIDVAGMENLKKTYTAYKPLGGNGTGEELYNRAIAMPIRNDD